MTPPLNTILAPLDRASVERERDRLREELEDYEALLRLIDRHATGPATPSAATQVAVSDAATAPTNGNGDANGNGHKPLSQKREAVLAILRERPGRWTNADLRAALVERGIDPHAGTPVKNIMWKLAKDGTVHASGNGVYEFPALSERAIPSDEQEAMGV